MVLYTPLEYHDIYQEEATPHKLMNYKGRMVYARQDEAGQHRLVQLLSSNPEDFLAEEYTPGALLPNEIVHNSH